MQLSGINSVINSAQGIAQTQGTQQSGASFSNLLSDALQNVEETEAGAQAANEALLTGETDDIHSALIASQKAEIAVSLAVEVRNRMLEAYNNIMSMQV